MECSMPLERNHCDRLDRCWRFPVGLFFILLSRAPGEVNYHFVMQRDRMPVHLLRRRSRSLFRLPRLAHLSSHSPGRKDEAKAEQQPDALSRRLRAVEPPKTATSASDRTDLPPHELSIPPLTDQKLRY